MQDSSTLNSRPAARFPWASAKAIAASFSLAVKALLKRPIMAEFFLTNVILDSNNRNNQKTVCDV